MVQDPKSRSFFHSLAAKFAASRFLTTSLVIHIALISLLGGVVLFKAAQQQESFVAAAGTDGILSGEEVDVGSEAEEPVEFDQPSSDASQPADTAVSPASAISALSDASTASWTINAPSDQQLMGTSFGTEMKSISAGANVGGGRSGKGGAVGRMSGSLFGVKIETNKLGVILDVSGSAHPHLLAALKEIDANFQGTEIILYPGCGMSDKSKASEYDMKSARAVSARFEADAKNEKVVFGQIAKARKNAALNEYLAKLLKRDNVFVSVNDPKDSQISGCQFAFEKLIKDGVDTIYWFADFADKIDENVSEELARDLRRKKIRVIAHNFAGKPVSPQALVIVKKTDGEAISKVPGK